MKRRFAFILAVALVVAELLNPVRTSAISDVPFYRDNFLPYHDDTCATNTSVGAITLAGKDNLEKILNFFMRKGLNLAQASGIAGNIQQESGFEPAKEQGGRVVDEDYRMKNGVGFGLVQWTFSARQDPLQAEADKAGLPVIDLGVQLEFIWKELNDSHQSALSELQVTDDPVEAAVIFHDKYEGSADSSSAVRGVRGGNAQKIYDTYKDGTPLAGSTAAEEMNDPSGAEGDGSGTNNFTKASKGTSAKNCADMSFEGGNFVETLLAYAWPEYHPPDYTELMPAYAEAVAKHRANNHYVGGGAYPGVDCGGFVTTLMVDSGYEPDYNYGGDSAKGAGATDTQQQWAEENWEKLGNGASIDVADIPRGAVAFSPGHTFVFVGDVDGFEEDVASASYQIWRAPMAGNENPSDGNVTWYAKKGVK